MKVLGYIMLHYGSEFLDACIRAMDPFVEKIVILYSPIPTHRTPRNPAQCPDDENKLHQIAFAASKKIHWVNVVKENMKIGNEGQHRTAIFKFSNGYDMIINADSDEVWDPRIMEQTLKDAENTDSRYIRIDGFVNFWKTMEWEVKDGFQPVRIHNLKSTKNEQQTVKSRIYHFGYMIHPEVMRYKINIHGHRDEWRRNWTKIWETWTPDCSVQWLHPVSLQIWQQAEPFDKSTLPDLLKKHPKF